MITVPGWVQKYPLDTTAMAKGEGRAGRQGLKLISQLNEQDTSTTINELLNKWEETNEYLIEEK